MCSRGRERDDIVKNAPVFDLNHEVSPPLLTRRVVERATHTYDLLCASPLVRGGGDALDVSVRASLLGGGAHQLVIAVDFRSWTVLVCPDHPERCYILVMQTCKACWSCSRRQGGLHRRISSGSVGSRVRPLNKRTVGEVQPITGADLLLMIL